MPQNVLRVALPGYDAKNDTNLDHFSLYTDADNILIKEYLRGSLSFKFDDYPSGFTISHNLGYVPLFLVYVDDQAAVSPFGWKQIGNGAFSIAYLAYSDENTLTIFEGTNTTRSFKYYIFYDNQVGSSSKEITESRALIKVAKQGFTAFSKDPNSYLFHSDLNTFKIIAEGTSNISYTTNGTYTINHGVTLTNPSSFIMFFSPPDGYVVMGNGTFLAFSRDEVFLFDQCLLTTTQFKVNISGDGANHTIPVKWYIFETPLT